jgi:hypothetical protein
VALRIASGAPGAERNAVASRISLVPMRLKPRPIQLRMVNNESGIVDFLMAWIERENAPMASPREDQRLDGECKVETLEKG